MQKLNRPESQFTPKRTVGVMLLFQTDFGVWMCDPKIVFKTPFLIRCIKMYAFIIIGLVDVCQGKVKRKKPRIKRF